MYFKLVGVNMKRVIILSVILTLSVSPVGFDGCDDINWKAFQYDNITIEYLPEL